MSFIEDHLILLFIAAIICLILYFVSDTFQSLVKGLACGAVAAGGYYTLAMMLNKESNSKTALIVFIGITVIMTWLLTRQKSYQSTIEQQEYENLQHDIALLAQALDEIQENIHIIQSSPFEYTEEENAQLHEAFQMFYQMKAAFINRQDYPYIASINFIQDVFMRVYNAAQARYQDSTTRTQQEWRAAYEEEFREAEERRKRRQAEKQRQRQDEESRYQNRNNQEQSSSKQKYDQKLRNSSKENLGYFSGCDNKAALKKRYRELCKMYHPDSAGGNAEIFKQVQVEYKKKLASIA